MYLPTSRGPSRIAGATMGASNYGVHLATPGAIHTKGAWTELYSSTPFATQGVLLNLRAGDFTVRYLVDIGIGGAGSEKVIIPDVFMWSNNSTSGTSLYLPMRIPAGVRLAARHALSNAINFAGVQLILIGEDLQWDRVPRLPRATAFGVDAANTRGVTLTGNVTPGVKGSWVELSSATPHLIHWFVLQFGCDDKGAGFSGTYDLGVGGAGSEKVLLPDLAITVTAPAGDSPLPSHIALPVHIPAGSRVAARLETTLGDQTLDLVALGLAA